jgi:outer membrane protein assembly factor BamB
LDAATGKKLWVSKNACDRRVGAIRWQNGGQTYFITAKGKCLEPKTGKELWQIAGDTLDTMRGWVSSVVDENHLVREGQTTEKKGMVLGYRITPAKVEQIWSVPLADVPRSIIPCVYKGHAYVRGRNGASGLGDTTLCINLETGKVVGQAKGSKSFSSPVVGDGRIFNCDAAVTMYQNADPNDFRDLQPSGLGMVGIGRMKAVLRGVPETIGVYADGRFYVRTGDGIICYDMREADAK